MQRVRNKAPKGAFFIGQVVGSGYEPQNQTQFHTGEQEQDDD